MKDDIYIKTKEFVCKSKYKCDKCNNLGQIGSGFEIYDDNSRNIVVYFKCSKCGEKYFSSIPGHFEKVRYQAFSSPSLLLLRWLNKIFR